MEKIIFFQLFLLASLSLLLFGSKLMPLENRLARLFKSKKESRHPQAELKDAAPQSSRH